MKELDKLLDAVMNEKSDLIDKEADDGDREELIEALREKKRTEIIREIRTEYKNELKKEVDLEVQEELNQKKINDIKELMWSGFLLAFVVGLAVNQVTDIIGYLKGQITMESIWSTVAITGVLLLVCIVAYLYSFFSHAIRLLKSDKKKNEDLNNNETDC